MSVRFHSLMPYRRMHNIEMCNPTNTCATRRVHKGTDHSLTIVCAHEHDAWHHVWTHGTYTHTWMTHDIELVVALPPFSMHDTHCSQSRVISHMLSFFNKRRVMPADILLLADCATIICGCQQMNRMLTTSVVHMHASDSFYHMCATTWQHAPILCSTRCCW